MGVPPLDEDPIPGGRFYRRLIALPCVPVFLLAMGPMVGLSVREWLSELSQRQFILTTPMCFGLRSLSSVACGTPCNRSFNMWTLIGIGVAPMAIA